MSKPVAYLFCALLATLLMVPGVASAQETILELERTIDGLDGGFLIPGTTSLDVTLTITQTSGDKPLTALALEEVLPDGWTYDSLVSSSNPAPNLAPDPGDPANPGDPLNFVWFSVPTTFPYSLTYRVNLPGGEEGPATFSGQIIYRTDGPELQNGGCTADCVPVTDLVQVEPPEETVVTLTETLSGDGITGDNNDFYIPGSTVTVDVNMEAVGDKDVTALALEQTLPAGWTYGGLAGDESQAPDVTPNAGDADVLQFVWFSVPDFPANFSFTVNIPGGATGEAVMIGEVEYRTDGPALFSNAETFTLNELPCLMFSREAPDAYTAGGQVTITVTFTEECADGITALALEETLPAGWSFESASGEDEPNLLPANGATGTLQFVYFTVPTTFPASFEYILNVPAEETGDQTIAGEAIYRLAGPELRTGIVETTLSGDTPPDAVCQDLTVQLGADGTVTITPEQVDNGSSDEGSIDALELDVDTFTCADIGDNTVTLTVTDNTGNQSTCTATVTVEDTTSPSVECQDIEIPLGANGTVTITPAQVVSGSSDNCGNVGLVLDIESFDCNNIGANTVTVTATDDSGNTATCTATVTVVDESEPTALCQDVTVTLDANGAASITAADINNGSSDNCGIDTITVSPSSFDCTDLGDNTVTLVVTDVNGNVANCTATVTVEDNTNPTAICQAAITRSLGANGTVNITAADIDAGSTDNCSIATSTVTPSSFNCDDIGDNTVTLTVTDEAGNTDTCTTTVTIEDTTAPTVLCQDIDVSLGADGIASITADLIDAGSSDNCGIASTTISASSFNCTSVGDNVVTLTVTDEAGNSASCDAIVTVSDNTAPVVSCQGITVTLDANDTATIDVGDVLLSADDNCNIETQSVTPNTFTCDNVGDNTVTVTVTDVNGNIGTCTATVTVEDAEAPVAVCTDATVELDESGNAIITAALVDGGSSDNCSIATMSVVPSSFTCADVGEQTVTLTVMDDSGNSDQCTATVTVEDNTAPTAVCQDITVDLDANGNATITAGDLDGGNSDNCGVDTVTISPDTFTCENVGENAVTVTVTDDSGNTATCTATVTVADPNEVCEGDFCELDAVNLLSPDGDILVQQDAPTTEITFTSDVEVSGEEGCTTGEIEVEYFVNGASIGTSNDAGNDYPVDAELGIGSYDVVAVATDPESGRTTTSITFTFDVLLGRDQNADGYLDYPFEDLPNDADRWVSTVETPGACERTVVMVSVFGDTDGQDIRVEVANPADPTQTLTVIAPRELVLEDEQGVLIVSIACDLESLFAPDSFADLAEDLPTDQLVEGTAFFEVSLIVQQQGSMTFTEVEDLSRGGLVEDEGIEIRLDGLGFTPGLTPTFLSHPTLVGTEPAEAACSECLDVMGDEGEWESEGVQDVRRRSTRLSADVTELSTFVAAEIFDKAPTLEVTPDPNFEQIIGIVDVGDSATAEFTITNVGSGTVTGTVTINGPANVFELVLEGGQDADYSLATGQSETFTVEFTPIIAGDFLGIVTFTGSAGGPISTNVRGTGTVSPTGKVTNILGCGSSTGGAGGVYGDLAVMLLALGALAGMAGYRKRQHS